MTPGEVIDTSNWVPGRSTSLEEDRYIRPLEYVDAESAEQCPGGCGLTVLLAARLHDCDGLKHKRAEKIAQAQAKATKSTASANA